MWITAFFGKRYSLDNGIRCLIYDKFNVWQSHALKFMPLLYTTIKLWSVVSVRSHTSSVAIFIYPFIFTDQQKDVSISFHTCPIDTKWKSTEHRNRYWRSYEMYKQWHFICVVLSLFFFSIRMNKALPWVCQYPYTLLSTLDVSCRKCRLNLNGLLSFHFEFSVHLPFSRLLSLEEMKKKREERNIYFFSISSIDVLYLALKQDSNRFGSLQLWQRKKNALNGRSNYIFQWWDRNERTNLTNLPIDTKMFEWFEKRYALQAISIAFNKGPNTLKLTTHTARATRNEEISPRIPKWIWMLWINEFLRLENARGTNRKNWITSVSIGTIYVDTFGCIEFVVILIRKNEL